MHVTTLSVQQISNHISFSPNWYFYTDLMAEAANNHCCQISLSSQVSLQSLCGLVGYICTVLKMSMQYITKNTVGQCICLLSQLFWLCFTQGDGNPVRNNALWQYGHKRTLHAWCQFQSCHKSSTKTLFTASGG